jgi:2-C-methyl-D-erythritol 4-phosphate cytidylyltransferase
VKKYAIIVAGGIGARMGTETPKQFLIIQNRTILWHSINSFFNAFNDIEIIVVLPQEHLLKGDEIRQQFSQQLAIHITVGGSTRFESVKNGLQLVLQDSVVFVHDAVRCLISKDLIQRCYNLAVEKGSAIPTIQATDSIRWCDKEKHKAVDRNNIHIVQTPQTFTSSLILPAFNQGYKDGFTDEASVVEAFGKEVFLCQGDYNNIKITRPLDLIIAEALMK